MRRIIPAVTLVTLSSILWSGSARAEVKVDPAIASMVREPGDGHDRPDAARPPHAGDWLWELLMDRLTVPLGPADQNNWPPGSWRGHWIAAADPGGQPGRASDGQTPTADGFVRPEGSPVAASQASATRTSTRATAPETGIDTRSGGHTCDAS
jgi:hypothetical protein